MLTLLPTPIGNLSDISIRSLEALSFADVIMCEDVRVSKKLILLFEKNPIISKHFPEIFNHKQFISFHSHNEDEFLQHTKKDFFLNQKVVFMSDAGMPCISDPGSKLVEYAMMNQIPYDILPGACAAVSAYCFSGFIKNGFLFAGFLPHKQKDRKDRIYNLLQTLCVCEDDYCIVVYESPHRIIDSLKNICCVAPECNLFAIKEMTKLHQKYFRGKPSQVLEEVSSSNTNGEWCLVFYGEKDLEPTLNISQIHSMDIPPKIKAKLLSKITQENSKDIYEKLLKEK